MLRKKIYLFFGYSLFILQFLIGQQVPYNPVSYRIFCPSIYNPAITGSYEFTNITFLTTANRITESQTLSAHTRLTKRKSKFEEGMEEPIYSNIGIGGYIFNDVVGSIRNTGASATISYHIPVTRDHISFFALGLSTKGIFQTDQSGSNESDTTNTTSFIPNIDLGMYYYGAHLFVGLSTVNFFSNSFSSDTISSNENKISRHYFLTTGYKILIHQKNVFAIEPSLLIDFDDQNVKTFYKNIHPGLKLYYKDSFIGTYINNINNFSFLMHLQFPRVFVGTYVEFPHNKNVLWNDRRVTVEFTFGLNISRKEVNAIYNRYY